MERVTNKERKKESRYQLIYRENFIELYDSINNELLKQFDKKECHCELSEDNLYCIVNYNNDYVKVLDIKSGKYKTKFYNWRDFFINEEEGDIWNYNLKWGYPIYAIINKYTAKIMRFNYFSSQNKTKLITKIINIDGIYINNVRFTNIKTDRFTGTLIDLFSETIFE